MKILGLDIGAGTKDVFLYDSEKTGENCIKMILPSPTLLYVRKIKSAKRDLYIDGCTIGGGNLATQLKGHMIKGYSVSMSEEAAFSLYNRLDRVKALGIEIMAEEPIGFHGECIMLEEVNLAQIKNFFSLYMEPLDDLDAVAIALQDHGVPSGGISQNAFRLAKFKEQFNQTPEVFSAIYPDYDVPHYYFRMKSAVRSAKNCLPNTRIFIMDSTMAAIAGCLYDCPEPADKPVIAVNIGNSHVTASLISDNKIVGFIEHHTTLLDPEKLEEILVKLELGTLTDQEVVVKGGHGAFYLTQPLLKNKPIILTTGPKQLMLKNSRLKIHFAAPIGDAMVTGAFGLVKAVEKKLLK